MAIELSDHDSLTRPEVEEEDHVVKRIKLTQSNTAFSSPSVLTSSSFQLRKEYDTALPYHHAVLHNIFDDQILRNARREIKQNLCFTPKETDIYKVSGSHSLVEKQSLDELMTTTL